MRNLACLRPGASLPACTGAKLLPTHSFSFPRCSKTTQNPSSTLKSKSLIWPLTTLSKKPGSTQLSCQHRHRKHTACCTLKFPLQATAFVINSLSQPSPNTNSLHEQPSRALCSVPVTHIQPPLVLMQITYSEERFLLWSGWLQPPVLCLGVLHLLNPCPQEFILQQGRVGKAICKPKQALSRELRAAIAGSVRIMCA